MTQSQDSAESRPQEAPRSLEQLVYRVVQTYVRTRLDWKYALEWKSSKDSDAGKAAYRDAKAKVARDAFLAVRSRTDADFVEYFVGTLCSVPQFLPEEAYMRLTTALAERREDIRTLTLLALSAQG